MGFLLRVERLSRDFTLSRLFPLQMTKTDEVLTTGVITTEVIEEFRLGPEETKMVQWSSHSGVGVPVSADAQGRCVMETQPGKMEKMCEHSSDQSEFQPS